MFCDNCGAKLPENAKFCTSCGTPITPIQPQDYQAQPQDYQAQPQDYQAQPQDYQPQQQYYQPEQALVPQEQKKSGKAGLFVLLGVIFLLIVLIGGSVAWYMLSAPARALKKQLDLGQKYLEELDYDMAIETYMDAIEIDPQKPDAYLGLADVYVELKDYESAIVVLDEGLDHVKGEKAASALEERKDEINSSCKKAPKSKICGTVIIADADMDYSNDEALSGGEVSLTREFQYEGTEKEEKTNSDGYFEFEDILPGTYTLTISKDDYEPIERTLEITGEEEAVDLATMEIVSEEWAGEGTASGVIYDVVTGEGIENLTLKISDINGEEVDTIKTQASGCYTTPDLVFGTYNIEILDERGLSQKETYTGADFMIRVLGNTDIPNQDGTVSLPMEDGQIRIVLTWGEKPEDLDSHLWCEGSLVNYHVYYSAQSFYIDDEMQANLDLDDTESYGPETTTINVDSNSTYHFGVYNYSGYDAGMLMNSGATVQVYTESAGIPSQTFHVPAGSGYYWDVFTYNGATGEIAPVNTITDNYGNYLNNDYDEQMESWEDYYLGNLFGW